MVLRLLSVSKVLCAIVGGEGAGAVGVAVEGGTTTAAATTATATTTMSVADVEGLVVAATIAVVAGGVVAAPGQQRMLLWRPPNPQFPHPSGVLQQSFESPSTGFPTHFNCVLTVLFTGGTTMES